MLTGVKFNYPFPENLQQCDGYSHKQKFSLIDITGKVLQGAAGRSWMQQVRSSKEEEDACAARHDRLRHESHCVPLALRGC